MIGKDLLELFFCVFSFFLIVGYGYWKHQLSLLGSPLRILVTSNNHNGQSKFPCPGRWPRHQILTIEPNLYSVEDMCFGPSLVFLLPDFPPRDLDDGLIASDPNNNDRPYFSDTKWTEYLSVTHRWHPVSIDLADLVVGKKLRTGIYEVTCPPHFGDAVIVAKFARFEWDITYLENKTIAYEWIEGSGIGLRFLGHLTEGGPGKRNSLSRLHSLGIMHGDINPFNFLICDSEAVLIDFATARKCDDRDALRGEFERLSESLQDMSGREGWRSYLS
ncbi:hypothetical protein BDW69DRAFT_192374 [Aspergillus filifer]